MPDARQTSEVSVTPVITANLCCGLNSSTFNIMGFPGGSDGKESACNMGDLGSIPRLGRSPGGGHDNLLHGNKYSCLENPHGQRSPMGYSPGVTKIQTQLSD